MFQQLPKLTGVSIASLALCGCAMQPLSKSVFGDLPPVPAASGDNTATILFSSDSRFETSDGVPFAGSPVFCTERGLSVPAKEADPASGTRVAAQQPIAVTSVIKWVNTGFEKTCYPFVSFTPEAGKKYAVVNERVGGKGMSALFTGMAFQTCRVSVYQLDASSFKPVPTTPASNPACRAR